MPKRISDVNGTPAQAATPAGSAAADTSEIRVVIVTLDSHLAGAVTRARRSLQKELPGLTLSLHAATEWAADPEALERCRAAIATGDIIIVTMLFMEDHIQAVLPDLQTRRDHCDAMVCGMAAGEVIRLTRIGRFAMDAPQGGIVKLLKRLRGAKSPGQKGHGGSSGAKQMAMLRRLPRILKFIPGTAQDLRAYFLVLQYWLAGSDDNVAGLVRFLVGRYAAGPRAALRDLIDAAPPADYPDVGLYHPRLKDRITGDLANLPKASHRKYHSVGLLVMRSYVLAGNTAHYDAVIAALEERGLRVIPAFASGLDTRPAVDAFFMKNGRATVDALVSLTGFSLVGGPAYNDSAAAAETLANLDVPYLAAHALEFQTLESWDACDRGLSPVEATMMVAIPEIDGAIGPGLFGGRSSSVAPEAARDMQPLPERIDALADKVGALVNLRHRAKADRKLGVVLFNFPPNGGAVGTAAHLGVYASLFNTLKALSEEGYSVDVPDSVDTLRSMLIEGNAGRHGTAANVHARIGVDDHVRRERWLADIEAQWGAAPGRQQSDGGGIFVLGHQFGNVFVGVQPGFGYEGDPMRLLFEKGFAPTHAFSAFYRYIREDFGADAVLHFGTHGALEFMPGKQVSLSGDCWPERLIGSLPNFYLYAANNPSEATIAKRRSGATLVSYLTPPVAHAGLYRGLIDLRDSIDRWRGLPPEASHERPDLATLIQAQASELDLAQAEPAWEAETVEATILALAAELQSYEEALIPEGLHVVGEPAREDQRLELIRAVAEASGDVLPADPSLRAIVAGKSPADALAADALANELPRSDRDDRIASLERLAETNRLLSKDHEIPGLLRALDGRFVPPAPGGDLLRNPAILPTGRNPHGFDPFRIPSAFAVKDGAAQAGRLLERHIADGNALPETVALVLWGTDTLKTEGCPIGQALALIGAEPRFDSFGRLTGATLIPLEQLGRPRIDVVMTLSGIFRDLLPLQTKMLAEAALLAASAEEPLELNFLRRNALAHQARHGCDLETAALRVFSNADGAYGSNVNHLIDSGSWDEEDELAETFTRRKCFAYGSSGQPVQQAELLESILGNVDLAYQNLESVELGVTTIDHYFDTLGGISRSVTRARGDAVPVYIGDQTRSDGTVRTLTEQVALETRTRMLNPKWYEGMLEHGYEGVRQIEAHVTNTMGWSATTGQVASWVYQQITQTFVLDDEMRARMAELNPSACAKVANRLLEAHERQYWTPDDAMLEALRRAGEELEDRLEGVGEGIAA